VFSFCVEREPYNTNENVISPCFLYASCTKIPKRPLKFLNARKKLSDTTLEILLSGILQIFYQMYELVLMILFIRKKS